MIFRLNPAIPVDTPKGPAYAHAWFDYSQGHHVLWMCEICATGEPWLIPQPEIRFQRNESMGVRI